MKLKEKVGHYHIYKPIVEKQTQKLIVLRSKKTCKARKLENDIAFIYLCTNEV